MSAFTEADLPLGKTFESLEDVMDAIKIGEITPKQGTAYLCLRRPPERRRCDDA